MISTPPAWVPESTFCWQSYATDLVRLPGLTRHQLGQQYCGAQYGVCGQELLLLLVGLLLLLLLPLSVRSRSSSSCTIAVCKYPVPSGSLIDADPPKPMCMLDFKGGRPLNCISFAPCVDATVIVSPSRSTENTYDCFVSTCCARMRAFAKFRLRTRSSHCELGAMVVAQMLDTIKT